MVLLDEDRCPICDDVLTTAENDQGLLVTTGCAHTFHDACLTAWRAQQNTMEPPVVPNTCPICRQPVVIAPRRDQNGRFRPNDGDNLREAIREMITDRPAALARYGPVRDWNTERVIDFSGAFVDYTFPGGQRAGEEDDVSGWDTSAATSMRSMFARCRNFNQPLRFDTHTVTEMGGMFSGCTAFDQPLTFNDTGAVTRMDRMFFGCIAFNQPLNFNTRSVRRMSEMFCECRAFNQPLTFDTGACEEFEGMFAGCRRFNELLDFDTRSAENMQFMFFRCTAFNRPLNHWNHWNYRHDVRIFRMFDYCENFQCPVFPMLAGDYFDSQLPDTPLGQSAVMQEALSRARRVNDPATQGRMISCASVKAARALGAPVRNAQMAARARVVNAYAYRAECDDDEVYLPRDDDNDDSRRVRPRYR